MKSYVVKSFEYVMAALVSSAVSKNVILVVSIRSDILCDFIDFIGNGMK